MTTAGMMLLEAFALAAGLCLWLYWRERQEHRRTRRHTVAFIRRLWRDRVLPLPEINNGYQLASKYGRSIVCEKCGARVDDCSHDAVLAHLDVCPVAIEYVLHHGRGP